MTRMQGINLVRVMAEYRSEAFDFNVETLGGVIILGGEL